MSVFQETFSYDWMPTHCDQLRLHHRMYQEETRLEWVESVLVIGCSQDLETACPRVPASDLRQPTSSSCWVHHKEATGIVQEMPLWRRLQTSLKGVWQGENSRLYLDCEGLWDCKFWGYIKDDGRGITGDGCRWAQVMSLRRAAVCWLEVMNSWDDGCWPTRAVIRVWPTDHASHSVHVRDQLCD